MVPRSPPAGRRVNLWQVSPLVHLRSVSVTLLTVPAGRREDTLHRTAVTRLLMNTEELGTFRRPQNAWEDSSRFSDHSLAGCRLKWSVTWLPEWECGENAIQHRQWLLWCFEINSVNLDRSLWVRERVAFYARSDTTAFVCIPMIQWESY